METLSKYFRFALVLFITLLFSMVVLTTPVDANSGQIDYVIMRIENSSLVKLPIDQYVDVYLMKKGKIYDFLIDKHGFMEIAGIMSGDKYIDIDEYINNYIAYGPNQWDVLENSEAMSEEIVSKIKDISKYEIEIVAVNVGEIDGNVDGNRIAVTIPKEIAELPIGYIEMNFSQEVKIIEINEEAPWLDIIDRFKQNGYNLSNYYSDYKVRTSWTYARLVKVESSTSYTVMTKDGYKEMFYIQVNIQ